MRPRAHAGYDERGAAELRRRTTASGTRCSVSRLSCSCDILLFFLAAPLARASPQPLSAAHRKLDAQPPPPPPPPPTPVPAQVSLEALEKLLLDDGRGKPTNHGCQNMAYLPDQKVIFCTAAKSSSTVWRRFLKRVNNDTAICTDGSNSEPCWCDSHGCILEGSHGTPLVRNALHVRLRVLVSNPCNNLVSLSLATEDLAVSHSN